MATVIQPLVNGARVAFTITIPIPATIQTSYGKGIVVDTLPAGFGLFTGEGTQNKVTVDGTDLTEDTDYTKAVNGQDVTYTINNDKLTASKDLVITIDTTVTNSAIVESPSTNTANLTFENVTGILGTGSVEYSLINPGPITYTGKTLISGMTGAVVPITLSFTTDATADAFNYTVENDYGADLDYVSASYKVGEGADTAITPTTSDTKRSFLIPHTASSTIVLTINTTMNATGGAKATISNTANLLVGGIQASTDTDELTIVPAITVTKALKTS